ncbi:unnamed protein product [Rhodiola kirilowii]
MMPSCCVINQHAHLVVEMIYINLLACQTHKACFVAFWDEITLATHSHNDRISEDHIISKWRIVVVRELPFLDQRLNGKIPKIRRRSFQNCQFYGHLHTCI